VEVEREPLVLGLLRVGVLGAAAVDHFPPHRQVLEEQTRVVVQLPLPPLPPRWAPFSNFQELTLEVLWPEHLLLGKERKGGRRHMS